MKTKHTEEELFILAPQTPEIECNCGCLIQSDDDGYLHFHQCQTHAAAPELLEALQEIYHDWQTYTSQDYADRDEDVMKMDKLCQTAIAKATESK